jgi:RND superfamily putative drug exporter
VLARLATASIRHRRGVLAGALIFFLFAFVFGGQAAKHLSASNGFADPRTQSLRASLLLQDLGVGAPGLIVEMTPRGGNVDSTAGIAAGSAATDAMTSLVLKDGGTTDDVLSYWNTGSTTLRTADRRDGLMVVRLSSDPDVAINQQKDILQEFQPQANRLGVDVKITGAAAVFGEMGTIVAQDLVRAEGIAISITLVLLVLIFGSAVAAALPLVVGLLSMFGAMTVLRLLATFTGVSVYGTELATALGLGLGIDYGLFIVTRYREEIAAGREPRDAAVVATRTSGRTVLFSALTVAAALAALMVFPLFYLKTFGYAGIAATLIAALSAVTVLPALLVAWSRWLDRADLRKPLRKLFRMSPPPAAGLAPEGGGIWHKIAIVVMRRPALLGGAVVALLILLGLPFLGVKFGQPDDRALPPNAASHVAMQDIQHTFGLTTTDPVVVVSSAAPPATAQMAAYEKQLSTLKYVDVVNGPAGSFKNGVQTSTKADEAILQAEFGQWGGSWVQITPTVAAYSPEGGKLVGAVRAVQAPFPNALVGGNAAQLVDSKHSIAQSLPLAATIMALVTLVVLFLFTGSVFLPVKAVLMTLLSLTATFGVMVWGFQEGHLAGLLNFNVVGTLDTTIPILMFCVVFGLSMDYEVFLLSRIKEEYDRSGDNQHAVATGLEKTGRVVSAAASLLAIVFIAFATSRVQFVQLLGVGAAVAVVVDATLVRAILVPSFMALMGDWNWWAPAPLRKLWDRIGLKEAPDSEPVPSDPPPRRRRIEVIPRGAWSRVAGFRAAVGQTTVLGSGYSAPINEPAEPFVYRMAAPTTAAPYPGRRSGAGRRAVAQDMPSGRPAAPAPGPRTAPVETPAGPVIIDGEDYALYD